MPAETNVALLFISAFRSVFRAVFDPQHRKSDFLMRGGRGSTKSSFISICIILLIVSNPDANAVVIRRQSNTLRESVYEQIVWAIEALGLTRFFKYTVSPMEITYLPTGQKIKFRGMDDESKVKGTKFSKGYCAIVWWEEFDQIDGYAKVRSVKQSLRRGGPRFWWFYSYNPPRSNRSWVNERAELMQRDPRAVVSSSTYLDVVGEHPEWLGEDFVDDAEQLKAEDEQAYRHEYLGEPVGLGTEVFDRVEFRTITDEEIASFDNPKLGQDFGWYPDPWAFVCSEWQQSGRTLLTWYEDGGNKLQPNEQAKRILSFLDEHNMGAEPVLSDDAAPQDIQAQRSEGVNARAAEKGGMRDASYKFLQSCHWVIDPERCPKLAEEVRKMEYEVNRDGEVLNTIPDGNDHYIDATRYALMRNVRRARTAYKE